MGVSGEGPQPSPPETSQTPLPTATSPRFPTFFCRFCAVGTTPLRFPWRIIVRLRKCLTGLPLNRHVNLENFLIQIYRSDFRFLRRVLVLLREAGFIPSIGGSR